MQRLLLATRNRHKTAEFSAMLGAAWWVEDLNAHARFPEVEETGATFRENAVLKALGASRVCQEQEAIVLADDSGLEVDALAGAPGVRSARFAGEGASDAQNLALLLERLRGEQVRAARFRCVIAAARGGALLAVFEGACEGRLLEAPRGTNGFGYDPVFVPEGYEKSFAELPGEVKNRLSHRARALQKTLGWLKGTK